MREQRVMLAQVLACVTMLLALTVASGLAQGPAAGCRAECAYAQARRRQAGLERRLAGCGAQRSCLRVPPMQSVSGRMPRVDQPDRGLRVRGAVTTRTESSALQARALGQDPGARHVDEPRGPGHDLPAARDPAARTSRAHLPLDSGHHASLPRRNRWRRRLCGASCDPDRPVASTIPSARSSTHTTATRSATGRVTRWCSTPSGSPMRRGSRVAASFIPTSCASWRNSRAPGTT